MANKIVHHVFFLDALRTALIVIAGFLTYEILKVLEINWNKLYPNNELIHLAHRKLYHFIIIFIFDLLILYLVALLFDVHL
jgi:hypothetical protein